MARPRRSPTPVPPRAERLIWARGRKGWSQAQLARALKTGASRVGHWETGERQMGVEDLQAVAALLEVDFEWLALGTGQPDPAPRFHPGLARACWEEVLQRVDRHADEASIPPSLFLTLYLKAAAKGLDRTPPEDRTLPGKVKNLS